jgi:hypothetical protein
MPRLQSLDDLISKKAGEFADQIRAAASMATKEEEIRIEAERQLAFIEKEAGVKLEGRHEFTVASGRVDSVYDRVIIEYKNPSDAGARIGPRPDSPGTRKVVKQIQDRFYDMRSEHRQALNTLFGVGLDGKHFVFIRFRDDQWHVEDPVPVSRHSAERFLWALFNLGSKGKPFSPEYLAGDFGAEAKLAQEGIRTLFNAIAATTSPKAQTFFSQWKILFGEVCGYDIDSPSDKIKKLADFYGAPTPGVKTAELLFAVHTYYAIFMKLLAAEIVAFFHRVPTPLQKMMQAGTGEKLRREMEDLEAGGIFRHLNITNFLEGDLFAWYTAAWSPSVEKLVRDMVARLDNYNPGSLSEDPSSSRDLLKKLYHQLFPKSVRHDLGEYYTPDWLAEHVLNELGYVGDPDKRLLDPACGSGTFLVMAINRIRKWYDENRERCRFGEDDLCRKILANVVGFDLNPLAVMTARTNYLIAIRQLVSHVDKVEIPVYLCDSILTPSEYGDTGQREMYVKPMEVKTSAKPTPFFIPREVTRERDTLAAYAALLGDLSPVLSRCSADEFVQRCREEGIPVTNVEDHRQLFTDLRDLDKANKNGVWARLIKNAFAPLFIGKVDYVAGNPPWVNWESLPEDYRDSLKPLWQSYGLFTLSGSAGRLGGGKKDLAMLFVYGAADHYLNPGGRLGFVITQTVFKTKGAGDGFRQLCFEKAGGRVVLKPIVVHDLSRMQVFEGATNRTAVFVCEKGTEGFAYPVRYVAWSGPSRIAQDAFLPDVLSEVCRSDLGAIPVDPQKATSPWLTAPPAALAGIKKVLGKSEMKAYAGSCTWLNGVFWVRILQTLRDGNLLVENLHDVGKSQVEHVEAAIEPDLVYPLLRGRDVARWHAQPSAHLILTQDPQKRAGIPEKDMRRKYPKTYAYLKQFEDQLRRRSGFRKYFDPSDPFYAMYNVGFHTMAEHKVVWREQSSGFQAAVAGSVGQLPLVPDHKLMTVPCECADEAHYLAALFGSSPCRLVVCSYVIATSTSTHVLEHIAVPRYEPANKTHTRLAALSKKCHAAVGKSDMAALEELERQIDRAAADVWGINRSQLKVIEKALPQVLGHHRGCEPPEDPAGEGDGPENEDETE